MKFLWLCVTVFSLVGCVDAPKVDPIATSAISAVNQRDEYHHAMRSELCKIHVLVLDGELERLRGGIFFMPDDSDETADRLVPQALEVNGIRYELVSIQIPGGPMSLSAFRRTAVYSSDPHVIAGSVMVARRADRAAVGK
ncbi:MAG: hypothetical protein JNK76_25910 [Planctomycetales bacterium]|nr:hypothetical protein [Planctomycetales bacterium]